MFPRYETFFRKGLVVSNVMATFALVKTPPPTTDLLRGVGYIPNYQ